MEWNVFYHCFNADRIEVFNVFDHDGFMKYVQKHLKECTDKKTFTEKLKTELHYFFWSKCEWELIIKITEDNHVCLYPWVGSRDPESVKIDVTDDKSFDWRSFAEHHINRQVYVNEAKIDVSDQVEYRWDEFVDYVWSFKRG